MGYEYEDANMIISQGEIDSPYHKLRNKKGEIVACCICEADNCWVVDDNELPLIDQVFTCEGGHELVRVGGADIRPYSTINACDLSYIEQLPPTG